MATASAMRRCLNAKIRASGIKKKLFGPVCSAFINDALKQQTKELDGNNTTDWNYDFKKDKPLLGRYEWDIVKNQLTAKQTTSSSSTTVASSSSTVVPDIVSKPLKGRVIKQAVRRRPCTRSSSFNTPLKAVRPDYHKLFAPTSPPSIDRTKVPQPVTRRVSPTSAAKALLQDTLAKVARSPRIANMKRKRTMMEVTGKKTRN